MIQYLDKHGSHPLAFQDHERFWKDDHIQLSIIYHHTNCRMTRICDVIFPCPLQHGLIVKIESVSVSHLQNHDEPPWL